jgi:hypothetical protein
VALMLFAVEALRVHIRRTRRATADRPVTFVLIQLAAGIGVAIFFLGHQALLRDTISHTSLDLLHFSLHPWETSRLTLQVGLLLAHTATIGLSVLILRGALNQWRFPRRDWRIWALTLACWTLPLVAWQLSMERPRLAGVPLLAAVFVAVGVAASAGRFAARYRHGSQAFRLMLLTLPMIASAFAFYPAVVQLA